MCAWRSDSSSSSCLDRLSGCTGRGAACPGCTLQSTTSISWAPLTSNWTALVIQVRTPRLSSVGPSWTDWTVIKTNPFLITQSLQHLWDQLGANRWHNFKQHLHISGIVGEKVWAMLCCEDGLGGTAADGKPFYISMNNLRIDDRGTGFQILKIEH